jgi:O-antigen ligase
MVSQWLGVAPEGDSLPNYVTDSNPLDRNILALLMLAGAIALAGRRREVGLVLRRNAPFILFFAYCAVSIVWSDFADVAFKRWIKAVGDVLMIVLVITDPGGPLALKRFLARITFVLVPVSVLLIKYYPKLGTANKIGDGRQVFTGVTNDKNMLGVICLVAGLAAAWRVLHMFRTEQRIRSYRRLIAQGVMLALVFWLFTKAGSLTALVCFGFGFSLILLTSFSWLGRKRAVVHAFVVLALAAAALPIFLDAGGSVLTAVGKDPTLTGRTELWGEVVALTTNPLGGAGFESFWLGPRLEAIWSRHWWHPNEAHNGYLEVYLNLGWAGVALIAIVIVTGYRNALRLQCEDPEAGGLRLAFFLVGVIYGLSEAAFRMLHPVWLFFLLATIAVPDGPLRKVLKPEKIPETADLGVRAAVASFGQAQKTRPRAAPHRVGPPYGRRRGGGNSIGEQFR